LVRVVLKKNRSLRVRMKSSCQTYLNLGHCFIKRKYVRLFHIKLSIEKPLPFKEGQYQCMTPGVLFEQEFGSLSPWMRLVT